MGIAEQKCIEIIDYIASVYVSIKEDLIIYPGDSKVLVVRSKTGLPFVSIEKESIDYFAILDYKFDWEYRKINGRYMLLDNQFYESVLEEDDFDNIPNNFYNTVAFDGTYDFLTLKEIEKEIDPIYNILEKQVPWFKKRVLQFQKEERY